MSEISSHPENSECISPEEYKNAWLNVLIDEVLLECCEGLL